MRRTLALTGVVLVALSTLTGCSGEMSRADACAMLAQRDGLTGPDAGPEYDVLTKELATRAPEPMRGYVIDTRDWKPPIAGSGEPQIGPITAFKEIAERHGFDRAIFCSS